MSKFTHHAMNKWGKTERGRTKEFVLYKGGMRLLKDITRKRNYVTIDLFNER